METKTRSLYCCATDVAANNMKDTQFFMYGARWFCPILNQTAVSRQIFLTVSNMKFYKNSSTWSRADSYRLTGKAKLIVAFHYLYEWVKCFAHAYFEFSDDKC